MKVFCDIVGHHDLAYSILALFSRVGGSITFPNSDPEWHKHLHTDSITSQDLSGAKFVTVEEFNDTDFDVYVSTCYLTERWVADQAKGKGLFIRQINNLLEQPEVARNVLMGVRHIIDPNLNRFDYIPEHPPRYKPNTSACKECSVLTFSEYQANHPAGDKIWDVVCSEFPEVLKSDRVPEESLHELFWKSKSYAHIKATGGCGFTLREAMFCGLPVLVDTSWSHIYKTPAKDYLVDQVNCIDLAMANRTRQQSVQLLKEWIAGKDCAERNEIALTKTKQLINFEQEASDFKSWLLAL